LEPGGVPRTAAETPVAVASCTIRRTAVRKKAGVGSGPIRLRRIDGWQKIAAVLSQHAAVAA